VDQLVVPTLGDGEKLNDLIADRTAFEDFDPDGFAKRGYGFVALAQLALEHLLGAR
jgi:xylose isomerase